MEWIKQYEDKSMTFFSLTHTYRPVIKEGQKSDDVDSGDDGEDADDNDGDNNTK